MEKRPLCIFSVMFFLGIGYGLEKNGWFLLPAAGIGMICFIRYRIRQKSTGSRQRSRWYLILGIFAACFLTGFFRGQARSLLIQNTEKRLAAQKSICIQGKIYQKEIKNNQVLLYVKHIYGQNSSRRVPYGAAVLYVPSDNIPIGANITVTGIPSLPEHASNEGGFDEKNYDNSLGILFSIKNPTIKKVEVTEPLLSDTFYFLSKRMQKIQQDQLPGEESGILEAMTLGEKSQLTNEAKDLFQLAGLSHILAISGLHISVIGMALYRRLRKFHLSFLTSGILAAVFVLLYAVLCKNSVSTMRAAGMFLILMLGEIGGENYDSLTALAVLMDVLLWMQPCYIGNTGFLFSFLAVIGVVTVAAPLSKAYEKKKKADWEKKYIKDPKNPWKMNAAEAFRKEMISAGAIQLFSMPLMIIFFNNVPMYVMILNLLLLPLLPLLLKSGLSGTVLGLMVSDKWQPYGILFLFEKVAFYICHLILYTYELLAEKTIHLPMADLMTKKPSPVLLIVYYGMLYFFVFMVTNKKVRHKGNKKTNRKKRTMAAAGILVCCFMLLKPANTANEVVMLDVGQGDGIFLSSKTRTYFIDGGSSSCRDIWKYTIQKFLACRGIRHIDYWFVTHTDADHISGVQTALDSGYKVSHLVFAKGVAKTEAYDRLIGSAKKNNSRILYMVPKDIIGDKEMNFVCLYPEYPPDTEGTNENCLALLMSSHDFQGIFTGDLTEEQEKLLQKNEAGDEIKKAGQIELMKAAHHGSNLSNSQDYLSFINPEVCLISAGKNNRYGHPGKETLKRLKNGNIDTFCTIESGEIQVLIYPGTYVLKQRKKLNNPEQPCIMVGE